MASGLPFPYRVYCPQDGQSGVLRSPSGIYPWEAARRPMWRYRNVVPVGDTGTIPYSMRQHAADFVGAAFDSANAARNEGTQSDFLPALKRQYKLDQQHQI